MLVALTLKLRDSSITDANNKADFWQGFHTKHRGGDSTDFKPTQADTYEDTFRSNFPSTLERLLNEHIRQSWNQGWHISKAPQVQLRLVSIEYSSIKAIIDFIGKDEILNFIMNALEAFSIQAFQTALNTTAPVSSSVQVVGRQAPAAAGMMNQTRAWTALNTSFLVPVVLALGVCYFAWDALGRELERLKAETTALRAERTEILKSVSEQNTKMTALMLEHWKTGAENTYGMERFVLDLLKARTIEARNPGVEKTKAPDTSVKNSRAKRARKNNPPCERDNQ